jgi:hypothetical protein
MPVKSLDCSVLGALMKSVRSNDKTEFAAIEPPVNVNEALTYVPLPNLEHETLTTLVTAVQLIEEERDS